MRFRAWLALLAAAGALAGCATAPAPVRPVEAPAPASPAPPPPVPMIEYPPIEPVEPARVPVPVAAPAASEPAPAAASPPAVEPATAPAVVPPTTAELAEERELAALLSDLQRYGALGAEDVKRELNTVTQALARQRNDANRIRLAVLYTLVKSSPQDDQRALQLLESVTKANPGSPAVKQLAAVLYAQVAERARAVRDEQQKVDAALKKLDALRSMERDLLRDRVRGGGGGAGGGGSSGGGGGGGGG